MAGKSLKAPGMTTSSTWRLSLEDIHQLKAMEEDKIRYINPYTGLVVKSKDEIFQPTSPVTYHYVCVVCGRTGKVLYCDYGSNPNLQSFLEGEWECPSCVYNKTSPMERENAEDDTEIELKRFNPDLVYSRRKKNRSQDGTHA